MSNTVSFLRHAGWVSPEFLTDPVTIVGCGAVGSNIALTAAKMGFTRFQLFDNDDVEPHNLPNQAYDVEHIGMPKVEALSGVLRRFNPEVEVVLHNRFFTKEDASLLSGPLVIATDTMKSRKEIYEAFNNNVFVEHVFEVRLGFDYGELNIVDPLNSKQCQSWYNTLRDDKDIPEGPCNLKIITTLVGLVSNYAVHSMCAKYAARSKDQTWEYNSKTMFELAPILKVYSLK
jgi:hypothetical protein